MSGEKHAGGAMERGKRLALVVGVNSAPKSLLPPLLSARRDAEAVAHVLETHCDFTLLEPPLLEEQATSAAIKKVILDLMEQGGANDFLLFYFSGHGQPIDVEAGRNEVYLGTHDFVEKHVERDETLHVSCLTWRSPRGTWEAETTDGAALGRLSSGQLRATATANPFRRRKQGLYSGNLRGKPEWRHTVENGVS